MSLRRFSRPGRDDLPPEDGKRSVAQEVAADVEEMGLAEAIRELAAVTAELVRLDAMIGDFPQSKPGLSGKRVWLKGRKIALQTRVQRG